MIFDELTKVIQGQKAAGIRYEREGNHRFRDCVSVYKNGRLKFERYCYGEAASLVCTMLAEGVLEDVIQWDYDSCPYSGKTEAPSRLTGKEGERLFFDGKKVAWLPTAQLKKGPGGGGFLKGLLGK